MLTLHIPPMCEWVALNTADTLAHRWGTNPHILAFGTCEPITVPTCVFKFFSSIKIRFAFLIKHSNTLKNEVLNGSAI